MTAKQDEKILPDVTRQDDKILPDGMVFEAPPKARRGRSSYVWDELLAPLRDFPGQWVRVRDDYKSVASASHIAYSLKKGKLSVPSGEWDFAGRTILRDDGSTGGAVYAMFVGDAA